MVLPYRQPSTIAKSGPKHGILPRNWVPPHKCSLPIPTAAPKRSWWKKLWAIPIPFHYEWKLFDLWRCECGEVYEFGIFSISNLTEAECLHSKCSMYCSWWRSSSIEKWVAAGGEE